jgi:hypothetical protein
VGPEVSPHVRRPKWTRGWRPSWWARRTSPTLGKPWGGGASRGEGEDLPPNLPLAATLGLERGSLGRPSPYIRRGQSMAAPLQTLVACPCCLSFLKFCACRRNLTHSNSSPYAPHCRAADPISFSAQLSGPRKEEKLLCCTCALLGAPPLLRR